MYLKILIDDYNKPLKLKNGLYSILISCIFKLIY